jgi:hypothetical protein
MVSDLAATDNSSVELRALCQTSSSDLSNEKEHCQHMKKGRIIKEERYFDMFNDKLDNLDLLCQNLQ